MLRIEHLTKHYKGSGKGVTDLSLHIAPGDLYAFIGHNGAGKTTTLKCVAGIQYLNFIADIFGVGAGERKEILKRYGDAFEITAALGDLISSYSHGMKQKLALLAALLHRPELLILDEPFVGLDPKAALLLKEIMRSICREGGAVFFSTHVLDVAERLCNKVAIIKDGTLIASGDMETVRAGQSLESFFIERAADASFLSAFRGDADLGIQAGNFRTPIPASDPGGVYCVFFCIWHRGQSALSGVCLGE